MIIFDDICGAHLSHHAPGAWSDFRIACTFGDINVVYDSLVFIESFSPTARTAPAAIARNRLVLFFQIWSSEAEGDKKLLILHTAPSILCQLDGCQDMLTENFIVSKAW